MTYFLLLILALWLNGMRKAKVEARNKAAKDKAGFEKRQAAAKQRKMENLRY